MEELQRYYRESLGPRIQALQAAVRAFEAGDSEALDSIRRLAHALRGSGGSYGFPEITEAAKQLERGGRKRVPKLASELLEVLRRVERGPDEGGPERLLLVEDEPENQLLLKTTLATSGREILVAGTAAEALSLLTEHGDVRLIVLDLLLPDTDGRNLLLQLRDRPETAVTPIVVLTAKTGEQARNECLALGANAYVEKPFEPEAIAAIVADTLSLRRNPAGPLRNASTGLATRAALRQAYEAEVARARSGGTPVHVAAIGIRGEDGGAPGEARLREVASTVESVLTDADCFGTWDGGLLAVLSSAPAADGANTAAPRARLEAALDAVEDAGDGIRVCAGLAEVDAETPIEEAAQRAATLLSRACAGAGGRTVATGDDVRPPTWRVLMAEDDDVVAALVQHRLSREGFDVIRFADGAEAFDAAGAGEYALIILDVKMPGMDGFDFLQRFRATEGGDRTPVIMLTALGNEQDVVRGFELGADDYIQKPFSPVELLSRVQRLVARP